MEALDLEKHALFNLINYQHCIYKMYFCTKYPFKTNLQFLVNKCVGKGLRKMKSRELKKNEALDLEKHALFNLINCQHCIYKMYFCGKHPFKTNLQFLVNKCVGKGLRKMKSRELKT